VWSITGVQFGYMQHSAIELMLCIDGSEANDSVQMRFGNNATMSYAVMCGLQLYELH
jgi:hypothetical protein